MTAITFDTGMLIALERRKRTAMLTLDSLQRRRLVPVVPAAVYVEWWRGRTDVREEILVSTILEGMSESLCRAAGEALGAMPAATLVDACVMASAALRGGGVVYTSDSGDLARLSEHFPTVHVVRI